MQTTFCLLLVYVYLWIFFDNFSVWIWYHVSQNLDQKLKKKLICIIKWGNKRGRKKIQFLGYISTKLWPPPPKPTTFFSFFYRNFIRTCTQTRGDRKIVFYKKKFFLLHADYFLNLVWKSRFFIGDIPPKIFFDIHIKRSRMV